MRTKSISSSPISLRNFYRWDEWEVVDGCSLGQNWIPCVFEMDLGMLGDCLDVFDVLDMLGALRLFLLLSAESWLLASRLECHRGKSGKLIPGVYPL